MEAINTKINELLKVSAEDLMTDEIIKSGKFGVLFDAKMKRQEELMDELKELAKANKTLLGRTIQFPMADSYALYIITGVGKSTVQIKWLNWCDAWVDDRCGYGCRLSRKYAEQTVYGRDRLDEMFSNKKLSNVQNQ